MTDKETANTDRREALNSIRLNMSDIAWILKNCDLNDEGWRHEILFSLQFIKDCLETWKQKRNECDEAQKRAEKDGKYTDFSSL